MKCPQCHSDNTDTARFCSNCATSLTGAEDARPSITKTIETPKEELTTGSTFAGRYQVIEELGKGGMGRVYKVLDKETNERIGLKLIKPGIASDKNTIERFRNELTTARKISHRNVCRMFDLNKEKDNYYITMELVSGGDLKKLIRRTKLLPVGTAISIAKQICEGLQEAHSIGILHRDLKPSNIMVDDNGNAKIMDFGLARSIKSKRITSAGVIIGTPEYMSPEQVEGKEVDQRSDIYSLGVILYETMTGKVPFEGDTPFTIGMKHKGEMPKNPQSLNTQIPDDLSLLILKCMEKDKEMRYQGIGEVISELDEIEKDIPSAERIVPKKKPLTSREITVRFSFKKLYVPFTAIALAIVALIIWQPWAHREATVIPSDKPSIAVLRFKNNTGDENLDFWRSALSELLINDLSQSKHIYVLPNNRLLDILSKLNLENSENYSYEDLQKFESWSGFNQIITGEYYKTGDSFRVNITLHDADKGEIISTDSAEGTGSEGPIGMVDELTRKIKTLVRMPEDKIASDFDLAVGEITTESPEAYKFFSDGARHYFKTEYLKAIPLLENAVALDPGFAMAYRHLWASHTNLGNRTKGNRFLANIYGEEYGELEKAIDYAETAYRNYPESGIACLSLAHYHTLEGSVREAAEILENHLENFPDSPLVKRHHIENLINRKKYDRALTELDELQNMAPTMFPYPLYTGHIYLLSGQPVKAEQEYRKFLDTENLRDRFRGFSRLSFLYLSQGKWGSSKMMQEGMIETARERGDLSGEFEARVHLAHLNSRTGDFNEALMESRGAREIAVQLEILSEVKSYLGINDIGQAEIAAEEMNKALEGERNKHEFRLYYLAAGLIEIERENFTQAVENLERAVSLSYTLQRAFFGNDYVIYLEPLARAHYRAGDWGKARREYEKISVHPTARLDFGDIYAKSFYMLGKIYEEQDNKRNAIENYEIFLELWKDADPGLPEVADARICLTRLQDR
jgi:serine/threonine protein kinase/Flp pilus assembly protein TadD